MKISMAAADAPGKKKRCCSFENPDLFLKPSYSRHVNRKLTNETEDVPDGRDKDDQQIGEGQDRHGDDAVTPPTELFRGTQ